MATVDMPLEGLRSDSDFKIDSRFGNLHVQLSKGRTQVALTRLPITTIVSGFYERRANKTTPISNLSKDYIPAIEQLIRGGIRLPVDVYWSSLAPSGGGSFARMMRLSWRYIRI